MLTERPWGQVECLGDGGPYKVSRLTINPGQRTSLHSHRFRREVLTVVQGHVQFSIAGTVFAALEGQTIHIGYGDIHRIQNLGSTPVIVIETRIGTDCCDSDIYRYEDDYGRHQERLAQAGDVTGTCRQMAATPNEVV